MRTYLSVKFKSLAAEARIIRRAERAALRRDRALRKRRPSVEFSPNSLSMHEYNGLRDHRIGIVRSEARAAHLALGFLDGVAYRRIEGHATRKITPWARALELAKKYGGRAPKDVEAAFKAWKDEGEQPQTSEEKAADKAAREASRAAWAEAKAARAAARSPARAA